MSKKSFILSKAYPSPQYLKLNIYKEGDIKLYQEYSEMDILDKNIFIELENNPYFIFDNIKYENKAVPMR
jgi:hypothetical protein